MFVYSFRASTLRFLAVTVLAVAALVALAVFVPEYGAVAETGGAGSEIRYTDVRTNDDRLSFIGQFGYTVEEQPIEEVSFTLPEEFDRALAGYNEIQRQQGLDLSRYKKKTLTRYTYRVTNYEGYEGTVYINLLVHRDRVVGCDIASADPSGFVDGLFLKEGT